MRDVDRDAQQVRSKAFETFRDLVPPEDLKDHVIDALAFRVAVSESKLAACQADREALSNGQTRTNRP